MRDSMDDVRVRKSHTGKWLPRYQSIAGQSSVGFWLDWGLRAAAMGINVDTTAPEIPPHRSARSLHGTRGRMRFLYSCEAVSHLK
jgi:hypothetical protein